MYYFIVVIVSGVFIFYEDWCRGRFIVVVVCVIFGYYYDGYFYVILNIE